MAPAAGRPDHRPIPAPPIHLTARLRVSDFGGTRRQGQIAAAPPRHTGAHESSWVSAGPTTGSDNPPEHPSQRSSHVPHIRETQAFNKSPSRGTPVIDSQPGDHLWHTPRADAPSMGLPARQYAPTCGSTARPDVSEVTRHSCANAHEPALPTLPARTSSRLQQLLDKWKLFRRIGRHRPGHDRSGVRLPCAPVPPHRAPAYRAHSEPGQPR